MHIFNIFYIICWVVFIMTVWYKTDWILHYCELFNVMNKFTNNFSTYIKNNPTSYLPDYLDEVLYASNIRFLQFVGKLLVCPFCFGFWLSLIGVFVTKGAFIDIGPIYVFSLIMFLGIKKLS